MSLCVSHSAVTCCTRLLTPAEDVLFSEENCISLTVTCSQTRIMQRSLIRQSPKNSFAMIFYVFVEKMARNDTCELGLRL